MMRKGMTGEPVRQLQTMLVRLGYQLPRWGSDGDLGDETLAALAMFLRDHKGADVENRDDVVSDNESELVRRIFDNGPMQWPKMPTNCTFHDLRASAMRDAYVYGRRTWRDVRVIVAHQTACDMGTKPSRYARLGAHFATMQNGDAAWVFSMLDVVAHANGLNPRGVGIEVNGRFAGRNDDPRTTPDEKLRTTWDDPTTAVRELPMDLPQIQVEATWAIGDFIIAEVERHGGRIDAVVPHRCSSSNRQGDPGEENWKRIWLPFIEKHKLSDGGKGFKVGSGYEIPECWDSHGHPGVSY